MSDQKTLSWFGKHGNLSWKETFSLLHHHSNENITFLVDDQEVDENVTEDTVIPIGLCKFYKGKPVKNIAIEVKDNAHSEYVVYVSDPTAANHFNLPFSLGLGERMYIKTREHTKLFKAYSIQLKETTVNTGVGCQRYPTEKFQTYNECIENNARSDMLPSLGCMVPWMSSTDHCTSPLARKPEHESLIRKLRFIVSDAYGGMEFRNPKLRIWFEFGRIQIQLYGRKIIHIWHY